MADITFTSPAMAKDITVYATAGARQTLLGLAKANRIPIQFECENGECGSCAVQVTILERKEPLGQHLTEKEKIVLLFSGKISKGQIEDTELRDIPPPWRLACQYIVRDEDILVKL